MRKALDELEKSELNWKRRGLFLRKKRWPHRLIVALLMIALLVAGGLTFRTAPLDLLF